MDARYSKMVRDREHAQVRSDEGELQVCDLGFDDDDDDPSLQYIANEQHRSGLLAKFLQDSVRMPSVHPIRYLKRVPFTACCARHNTTVTS